MRNIKDVKKNRVIFISIAMVIAIIAHIIAVLIDNSHKVAFEDATMAEMISKSAGVETVDEIRENDLEKIEVLNIGYTGYYDTLVDIEKCTNLRRLIRSANRRHRISPRTGKTHTPSAKPLIHS